MGISTLARDLDTVADANRLVETRISRGGFRLASPRGCDVGEVGRCGGCKGGVID